MNDGLAILGGWLQWLLLVVVLLVAVLRDIACDPGASGDDDAAVAGDDGADGERPGP